MVWDDATQGMTFTEVPIPDDLKDTVAKYRGELIEAIAEYDDNLLEKFFEDPILSLSKRCVRPSVLLS